jgi:hypothetical protein
MQQNPAAQQPSRHRTNHRGWIDTLILAAFLILSLALLARTAAADPYTYRTLVLPFPDVVWAWVDGLTDTLTAVGSYQTSDGQTKSWIFDPAKGFRLYTEPGKTLFVQDVNVGGRVVDTYQDSTGTWHGFTKRGKDFRRLSLPDADVGGCKLNDEATIMCGYHKATGESGAAFWRATYTPKLLRLLPDDGHWATWSALTNHDDMAGYFENGDERYGPYRGIIRDGASGAVTYVDGPPCGGVIIYDMNDNRLMATSCLNVPEEGWQKAYVTNGDEPSWTEIAVPDAYETSVSAVNHRGQVAGSYYGPEGVGIFLATPTILSTAQR